MKIVVIGGTGLIGSKLVQRLQAQGHDVIAASPASGVVAGRDADEGPARVVRRVRRARGGWTGRDVGRAGGEARDARIVAESGGAPALPHAGHLHAHLEVSAQRQRSCERRAFVMDPIAESRA